MDRTKKIKMKDIADELGVSVVTVSNALKGKKGVGEKTRLEIIEKAQELGYKFPLHVPASAKEQQRSIYQVGIIIAERYVREHLSFYMEIYQKVAQIAKKMNCMITLEIVETEAEKQKELPSLLQSMELDGLLVIGEMHTDYIRKMHGEVFIPVVCVDFYSIDTDMDYIVTDGLHGMQMVTQGLIHAGHRDIGFVGTPNSTNSIMDRYMGYCKALQINGIKERPDRIYYDRREGRYECIDDIELLEDLPSAFVCNCDRAAVLLIEKLERKGLKIPEDVSVAGFDHYCNKLPPYLELYTYESDTKALAKISMNTLVKRMEKKKGPGGIRIVTGRIIEGNTVRKIGKE